MQRNAESILAAWAAQKAHKPLVLRGARQTGKTWLVKQFGDRFPAGLAHVNLEREPDLAACFAPNDPKAILGLLEARLRRTITPGKTLLFLDEIQAAPEILAKLRWFAEEMPGLHLIAAGSLLDLIPRWEPSKGSHALPRRGAAGKAGRPPTRPSDHVFSMPVGRITYGHLDPMTFAEFLVAAGEERLLAAIRACTPNGGVAEALHPRLLEMVRTYVLVGGMPAAVADWVEHRSFARTAEIHRDLLQTIRDDFAKYKRGVHTARVAKVFAALPRLVGRKFQPTRVDADEKTLPIRDAFRMLALARVVTPVQRSAANGIPLGAEVDERYQKVCLLDTGLYATQSGIDAAAVASQSELTLVNEGQLAEQFTGQELRACRAFNDEPALFTWVREARNSNAEVDYVIQVGPRIVPVEVKAGATGTLRSLHMMVAEKNLDVAVRVSSAPLQRRKVHTSLPIGKPRAFTLLSIPFYLVSEIPRLVGAMRKG